MAEKSGISWTEATWNPWYGCTKISPGCKNCYMYRDMERYGRDPFTVQRSKTTFHDPLKWEKPRTIFTCSWSDFFIEAADPWRAEAWEVIYNSPRHTYQILTKRPERIESQLPLCWPDLDNVQLGVSVESPEYLWRVDALRKIEAKIRFISIEPLLARIPKLDLEGIDWGIVGGESGSDRRPCEVSWITDIVDQFTAANVPIWVKQDAGPKPGLQGRIPDSHWLHQMPRKRNRTHSERPLGRG